MFRTRIPFIVRLHARLGTQGIITDSLVHFDRVESLLEQAADLRPMLKDLYDLVGKSTALAAEAQTTAASAQELSKSALPLLQGAERLLAAPDRPGPHVNRVESLVKSSGSLVEHTRALLTDVSGITHGNPLSAIEGCHPRLEQLSRRLLWRAALVGTGLITLFWTGYFLTRHSW